MQGYYQKPTIFENSIVFVCEDDLWWIEDSGGTAQRLTAHPGRVGQPAFAPDGQTIAFTGRDEGHSEVCLLRYEEGSSERLTFLGADTHVVTFSPDGQRIFYRSNSGQPFGRSYALGSVPVEGGPAAPYPWGTGRGHLLPAQWPRARA